VLGVLFYFIALDVIRGRDQVRRLLLLLTALSGVVAVYGILQYFHIDFIHDWVGQKHMFSTLGNPNFLAQYLVGVMPLCFAMIFTGGRRQSIFCGASFFFSSWALILTQTRAAWAGAFLSFVLMFSLLFLKNRRFIVQHKKTLVFFPVILLAAVTLLVGLNLVKNQAGETDALVHRIKTSPRDPFREFAWQATWEMFKDHPFAGVGLGHFRVYYPDYQASLLSEQERPSFITPTYVRRAHSDYLQGASELGLPGLALMLWLIFALFRHGVRMIHHMASGEGKTLAAGILAGCSALLVDALFSFPFHITSTGVLFICLAALMTSTGRAHGATVPERTIAPHFMRSPIFPWMAIPAAVILSLLLSAGAAARFIADLQLKKGYTLVNSNRQLDQAQAMLSKGIRWHPEKGKFYFALGSVRHRKGDPVRAVQALTRAQETFRDVNVLQSLGTAYMIKGESEKAMETWRSAIAIRPNATETLMCLGVGYLEMKRIDKAEKHLREAVIIDPKFAEAYYLLGHIYVYQKRRDRALKSWNRFLELAPRRASGLHLLALNSFRKGAYLEQVTAAWPEVLRMAPDNPALKEMVDQFQRSVSADPFSGRRP